MLRLIYIIMMYISLNINLMEINMVTKPTKAKATGAHTVTKEQVGATNDAMDVSKPLDTATPQPIVMLNTLYHSEPQIKSACEQLNTNVNASLIEAQRIILSALSHFLKHSNINVLRNLITDFPKVFGKFGISDYLERFAPVEFENVKVQYKGSNGKTLERTVSLPTVKAEKWAKLGLNLGNEDENNTAKLALVDKASRVTWWGKQVAKEKPYMPVNLYEQIMGIVKRDEAQLAKRAKANAAELALLAKDYIPAEALLHLKAFAEKIKPTNDNVSAKEAIAA